ncbi:ATP-binding protein [Candidatus Woesearchaeota archaeon]|nr:ATP-binding protein [Candidatus Woesearchaeota archaeon]
MLKGQILSGEFKSLVLRQKQGCSLELGELLVADQGAEKILLQVYDLFYGSQVSDQNLELISGLQMEGEGEEFLDKELRHYQLARLKPLLEMKGKEANLCKALPPFFAKVREIEKEDLPFLTKPTNPLLLGRLRSGRRKIDLDVFLPGELSLSHHILIAASTGRGKSNLCSVMLWGALDNNFAGILVIDPHDEYYGRTGRGLKDHPHRENLSYYTPLNPPAGAKTLKFHLSLLKPEHFSGVHHFSDPQKQVLFAYHRKYKESWVEALLKESYDLLLEKYFHEESILVVRRNLLRILDVTVENNQLFFQGIFDGTAGRNTTAEICKELESGKIVVIDTSYLPGEVEILTASILTNEIFNRYRRYKTEGQLDLKPVVSVILEEAARVLGKESLERGPNIFSTLAREGRKFKVGLVAITQMPSLIPKEILANINTKIILGLEMASERQAIIDAAPHDLSDDSRTIASLDKGEAIVSSIFTRFPLPLAIPLFKEMIETRRERKEGIEFSGVGE